MGCTSGKTIKKKTTSVEDVSQQKVVPQNAAVSPNKNGQIVQGKQPKIDSTSNAIQIPGANKSFLAPDGIPFIDEDVDSDTEGGAETQIPNAKPGSPSDQNKNIITNSSRTVTTTVVETKTSALTSSEPAEQPHGVVTTVTTSRVTTVESSHGGDEQPRVISEIMEQEMRQTSAANTASVNPDVHNINKTSVEVSDDSDASRQQQVAATKIQAGIRGYLDRKKVKAIRANQQTAGEHKKQEDALTKNQSGDDRHILTDSRHTTEETDRHPTEETADPKLHTAATKIQANYKGYKTRKELNLKKK